MLPPQYNPKEVKDKIYQTWEKSGFFNPDKLPGLRRKTFSMVVPPPNITGSLHMGHALNAIIQDILVRKKRMEGYKTLWLSGTDHAGIATQNVVEKELKKQGVSRYDLGQEKFLEKVWDWKEKYGHIILGQFKKLGSSMDWSRTRFTMDSAYQEAVKTAFVHYYERGWIYRAERVINWCSRCATSLSDLELEYKEEMTNLYYLAYPLADGSGSVLVATTRPETMLGDTAIAVNPKDKRYKNIAGKKVILPLQNREIPIVTDQAVEANFGTGAVKVTPAHDLTDSEIGARYDLPIIKVIGPDGRMTEGAGPLFAGLKTKECREKIIEELIKEGALIKTKSYKHNIAVCYRCGTTTEPIPSLQWFLKMNDLAKMAALAVRSGRVKFYPRRWEKIYFDWLKNVKDWCISRQIWWGHRLPVFYCSKKLEEFKINNPPFIVSSKKPARCPFCKNCNPEQSADVLDTWFSSALWPLATLGWPQKTKDFETFYPTTALSTARDIINLWVARMVFSGLEFTKKEPFQDVIIHATILTKEGKRMSKSLGTGVDPMNLVAQYGADAIRFGLIWQAMGGQDIHWNEEHVVAGKKFANKIWNASRFVLQQIVISKLQITNYKKPRPKTAEDKNILTALNKTRERVEKQLEKYEFGQALHSLYDFFWHDFCDRYLEASKSQMSNVNRQMSTQQTLFYVLANSLKLLHPFMPFITEEIWGHLPSTHKKLLLIEPWPQ